MKTTLSLALLLLAAPAWAHSLQWGASLLGRSTDDSFSSSRTVGVRALVNGKRDLADGLDAKFLGGATFETGSSSSLFTNEFEPKSRLLLKEASLNWRPKQFLVSAGALPQFISPLVLDSGTFPAALAKYEGRWNRFFLRADAQAAIPTSQTLSTRSTGKENTPSLLNQSAAVGFSSVQFGAQWKLTHFQFKNLTRGLAQDSRFYGNSVTGIGAASQFFYDFDGIVTGPDFAIALGKNYVWEMGGSALQNSKGPKSANLGYHAYADLLVRYPTFSLKPKIEWYRNEADSSPAYFSSSEFGHNNRVGYGGSVKLDLKTSGLSMEAKFRKSDLINNNTFQKNRFTYFELVLEIPYADF